MLVDISIFGKVEKPMMVIIVILLLVLSWYNLMVGMLCAIVAIAALFFVIRNSRKRRDDLASYIEMMVNNVEHSNNYALQNLPLAIAVVDNKSHICWSNSVFKDWFGFDIEKTQRLSLISSALRLEKVWGKSGHFTSKIEDRTYIVYHKFINSPNINLGENSPENNSGSSGFMALYYQDISETEKIRIEALESHPVFVYIEIDNIEDVTKGLNDIQATNLWAEVNNVIADEFEKADGFIRSYNVDGYIACLSRASLNKMIENNFSILDRVRNIHTPKRLPLTISLGIATEVKSVRERAEKARAGLDLALGRGGDQAAVYFGNDVKFYGGKTQGNEKNTRVRARVVAQAIKELINDSSNVIIMGHEREDYDSIGGAIGVSVMAKADNIPVHVVVSDQTTAINKLEEILPNHPDMSDLIITPTQAEALVNDKTLVFVVDVHRPDMVAAPKALEKAKRRVVIDHHRRSSDFIEKPLITYLEPTSSSTSELVTELIQYYADKIELNEVEASVLYAGIVVDTKNFIVQTGSRTFDAASYLRRSGANLDVVRRLFMENFELAKRRSEIISATEMFGEIAMTHCPKGTPNAPVLCAQIADWLITVEEIEMSFVFYYRENGGIGVSARSQGLYNVQVVMEALGGGGHRTVAGVQLNDKDLKTCMNEVLEAAREYIATFKKSEEAKK